MKKFTLSALAAVIFVTSVAAPAAYAAPVAPEMPTTTWTDRGSANEWTWALIRDGATLDAHMSRDNLAQPAPFPIFELVKTLAGPGAPQS